MGALRPFVYPPAHVHVVAYELRARICHARLPFRFGSVTMTSAPLLCARVEAVLARDRAATVGYSGDLLVPRWFDKDPGKSVEQGQQDLVAAARAAGEAAMRLPPTTVRTLVRGVETAVWADSAPLAPERLRHSFGAALIERAVLDAVTRACGLSFFAAVHANLFALPERVLAALPSRPASHVVVRHTIGMADPLRAADVAAADRLRDGLPQALDEEVRAYGLRSFKIKIGSGRAADLARLLQIHAVLASTAAPDWRCSLDANEQYADLDALEGLLGDLEQSAAGRDLLARLLHLEQPLPRAETFAAPTAPAVARLARRVPLLIDEADVDADAFAAALALGYRGVSVKNCKGVLRAIDNHAACAAQRAKGVAAFQSAEDLTNLPVLPLQQDLATVQLLGLGHAERNGHHYFAGLGHLPPAEAAAAALAHPDLYRARERGHALRIDAGRIALGSLGCPGYGYACAIDFAAREPV